MPHMMIRVPCVDGSQLANPSSFLSPAVAASPKQLLRFSEHLRTVEEFLWLVEVHRNSVPCASRRIFCSHKENCECLPSAFKMKHSWINF